MGRPKTRKIDTFTENPGTSTKFDKNTGKRESRHIVGKASTKIGHKEQFNQEFAKVYKNRRKLVNVTREQSFSTRDERPAGNKIVAF